MPRRRLTGHPAAVPTGAVGRELDVAPGGAPGLRPDESDAGHEEGAQDHGHGDDGPGRHLIGSRGGGGGSAACSLDPGRRRPCRAEVGRELVERGFFHDPQRRGAYRAEFAEKWFSDKKGWPKMKWARQPRAASSSSS